VEVMTKTILLVFSETRCSNTATQGSWLCTDDDVNLSVMHDVSAGVCAAKCFMVETRHEALVERLTCSPGHSQVISRVCLSMDL